jgi:hypothetical protein
VVAISDKEVEAEAEGVVAADVADIYPMPAAGGVVAVVVVATVPVAVVGPVC